MRQHGEAEWSIDMESLNGSSGSGSVPEMDRERNRKVVSVKRKRESPVTMEEEYVPGNDAEEADVASYEDDKDHLFQIDSGDELEDEEEFFSDGMLDSDLEIIGYRRDRKKGGAEREKSIENIVARRTPRNRPPKMTRTSPRKSEGSPTKANTMKASREEGTRLEVMRNSTPIMPRTSPRKSRGILAQAFPTSGGEGTSGASGSGNSSAPFMRRSHSRSPSAKKEAYGTENFALEGNLDGIVHYVMDSSAKPVVNWKKIVRKLEKSEQKLKEGRRMRETAKKIARRQKAKGLEKKKKKSKKEKKWVIESDEEGSDLNGFIANNDSGEISDSTIERKKKHPKDKSKRHAKDKEEREPKILSFVDARKVYSSDAITYKLQLASSAMEVCDMTRLYNMYYSGINWVKRPVGVGTFCFCLYARPFHTRGVLLQKNGDTADGTGNFTIFSEVGSGRQVFASEQNNVKMDNSFLHTLNAFYPIPVMNFIGIETQEGAQIVSIIGDLLEHVIAIAKCRFRFKLCTDLVTETLSKRDSLENHTIYKYIIDKEIASTVPKKCVEELNKYCEIYGANVDNAYAMDAFSSDDDVVKSSELPGSESVSERLEADLTFSLDIDSALSNFVPYIISICLEEDYHALVFDESTEGYDRQYCLAIRKVEQTVSDRKKLLASSNIWKPEIYEALRTRPTLGIKKVAVNFGTLTCQACNRKSRIAKDEIHLSGKAYDPITCRDGLELEPVVFRVGETCLQRAKLYHSLHHFKKALYNIAQRRINRKQTPGQPRRQTVELFEELMKENTFVKLIKSHVKALLLEADAYLTKN